MNNNFFQDCGFLVDDEGLNRELNDVRQNYFSFNNQNTAGELSEGDSSSGEESEPLDIVEDPIEGSECGAGATGSSEEDDFHAVIQT